MAKGEWFNEAGERRIVTQYHEYAATLSLATISLVLKHPQGGRDHQSLKGDVDDMSESHHIPGVDSQ